MGIRGRTSTAALSIVGPQVELIRRPEPLPYLSREQADEWRAVVARMPADWFPRETWALLVQHCRHTASSNHIDQLIEKMESADTIDAREYERLLRMQAAESRTLAVIDTKLRITQQATYGATKKKGLSFAKAPFD